jgi:hypothetical protein
LLHNRLFHELIARKPTSMPSASQQEAASVIFPKVDLATKAGGHWAQKVWSELEVTEVSFARFGTPLEVDTQPKLAKRTSKETRKKRRKQRETEKQKQKQNLFEQAFGRMSDND